MYTWSCNLCGESVSVALQRNLNLLVREHREAMCPFKDIPRSELPPTKEDRKFLEELKIGW